MERCNAIQIRSRDVDVTPFSVVRVATRLRRYSVCRLVYPDSVSTHLQYIWYRIPVRKLVPNQFRRPCSLSRLADDSHGPTPNSQLPSSPKSRQAREKRKVAGSPHPTGVDGVAALDALFSRRRATWGTRLSTLLRHQVLSERSTSGVMK